MVGALRRVRVLCLAATALLFAGCAGAPAPAPSQAAPEPSLPASAAGADCPADAVAGKQGPFGVRGADDLGGVLFGTGKVGIVLAHQAAGNLCDWASFARQVAQRGYRALAFDFSGNGSSRTATNALTADLAAAVDFLRSGGVQTVVLMGSSMGGTVVLAAAPDIQPPVAGVVAISAPVTWLGADAKDAVPRLTVPVLYLVGRGDRRYADDAQVLAAGTPGGLGKLVIVDAASHGVGLLTPNKFDGDAAAKQVRTEIDAFLAKVAPPG